MTCLLVVKGKEFQCTSSHCDLCPRSPTFDSIKSKRLIAESEKDDLELDEELDD